VLQSNTTSLPPDWNADLPTGSTLDNHRSGPIRRSALRQKQKTPPAKPAGFESFQCD
jgi:hypothetical protein